MYFFLAHMFQKYNPRRTLNSNVMSSLLQEIVLVKLRGVGVGVGVGWTAAEENFISSHKHRV